MSFPWQNLDEWMLKISNWAKKHIINVMVNQRQDFTKASFSSYGDFCILFDIWIYIFTNFRRNCYATNFREGTSLYSRLKNIWNYLDFITRTLRFILSFEWKKFVLSFKKSFWRRCLLLLLLKSWILFFYCKAAVPSFRKPHPWKWKLSSRCHKLY